MRELIRTILLEYRGGHNKSNTEDFIKKSQIIHGDLYDYSRVEYVNNTTPVTIKCKKHDFYFEQMPKKHLKGQGCPICGGSLKKTTEEFVKEAQNTHLNPDGSPKYTYDNVYYINGAKKVFVTCPLHGDFPVTPQNHISRKSGCPKCKGEKLGDLLRYDQEKFINLSRKVHGNIYDYSQVQYINSRTYVDIICNNHGVFPQKPADHLQGNGCPRCHESTGEKIINEFLKNNNITFFRQHKFPDCTNRMAPSKCVVLKFDFFLPEYNTVIEYDGVQHFKPSFGQKSFEITKRNDKIKNEYLKEKNIKVLRIPYTTTGKNLIKTLKDNLNL
jgi:hypothetical protein